MTVASKSGDDWAEGDVTYGDLEPGDLFVYDIGISKLILSVMPPKGSMLTTSLIAVKVLVVGIHSFSIEKNVGGRSAYFTRVAKRHKRKTS